ncbi:hypothetical protein FSARC_14433 [Fusarium sarcochroum]|uniref:Major facilitator superfamily (MFS) profile domain-containing protein n=1 Tax=Fusarium sarcochroum TaxID=1208366 RepID=A0A8H4WPE7_9HYPO|nr:hypothetical protein FSARC_14433 [Fusarium sarcochroum]
MATIPVPGTVHLVDLEGISNRKHGEKSDIILIPQPTADPNDPLNWSPMRRLNGSICHILWVFAGALIINGLTVAYLVIEQETGISQAALNGGNGLMYLFFGWGCLISQPIALNFGRRPSAVISLGITACLVLWAGYVKSAGEWYANRILLGFFFSGIESLAELCVTDTKFTHERGLHMGLYNWALYGGAFLSPIPAGFLASAVGWHWINRMYFIFGIAATVYFFFFYEETMFYRPRTVDEFVDAEPSANTVAKAPLDQQIEDVCQSSQMSNEATGQTRETYQVQPFQQRLKLWGARDPRQPNTFKLRFMLLPLYLMRYPSVFFSGILIGGVLGWFNVFAGTIPLVFGNPPYNFSTNMIGLVYLACFIGASAGCLVAGSLTDKLAVFMARRNKGIKEPEARLWAAVVPMILHPAGSILFGVGAAHGIHWVGLCFGLGLVTLGIVMGSTLALSYCVDCYKEVAGEAIVTIIVIRNSIGFGFGYAVIPMVNSLGLQGAFLLIAFLGMGLNAACLLMIAFGKGMRKASAASYWKLIEGYGFHTH